MKVLIFLIIITIISAGYYIINRPSVSEHEYTTMDPTQEPFQGSWVMQKPFQIKSGSKNLTITPVAPYKICARILHKQRYFTDWNAKISPYDLALGWGKLADENNLKGINFSHVQRFYIYRYDANYPLSQKVITRNSSNHHIIPATTNIKKALMTLKKGDIIELQGLLVNVSGRHKDQNIHWNTSITRTDTGDGSCEILYVEKLRVGNKVYK